MSIQSPGAIIPEVTPSPFVGWTFLHAGAVAVALLAITIPLAVREGRRHEQRWLAKLLIASLVLHFVGCIVQAEIVAHVYRNVADFQRYDGQGAALSQGIRHLHLNTAGLTIPGTGTVSVAAGVVYALIGVDQLGGFFVFSWLSFIGLVMFYRAARLAVPTLVAPRYAAILFLLPSLLYWPSQTGKEALMLLALGISAYGVALLLTGRSSGLVPLATGLTIGAFIRPHTVAVLAVAFAATVLFRRRPPAVGRARAQQWLTTVGALAALVIIGVVTTEFLHLSSLSTSSLNDALSSANGGTQFAGSGFGSSHSGWSSSPLAFPQDVVTVLLEPLPWRIAGTTQVIAFAENVLFVALLVVFRRSLGALARAFRTGGYLMFATIYSVLFLYIFAALGNIGLLSRERTLLFPLLLMLLCLPSRARPKPGPEFGEVVTATVYAEWDTPGILVSR